MSARNGGYGCRKQFDLERNIEMTSRITWQGLLVRCRFVVLALVAYHLLGLRLSRVTQQ